jgi:predicted nucleotidyltransferase
MRLLAAMYLNPDSSRSVLDWAEHIGVGTSVAAREVALAEKAGIVEVRRVGTSKLVSADRDSPFFEALHQLLVGTFGVPQILAQALESIPGVDEAYLFGSWAARLQGRDGPLPHDIDVMIIGSSIDRDQVYDAIDRVSEQVPRPVQLVFRTAEQWADLDDPFIDTVRSRPIFPILSPETDTDAADGK